MLEGDTPGMKYIRERVTVNGQQHWVTGRTMQEVFEKAANLINGGETGQDRDIPTFASYQAEWMSLYKEPKLRPTTYRTYKNLLSKHLVPYFGEMRLNQIKTNTVQHFYHSVGQLSHSSVKQMSVILKQLFDSAIEDGYIGSNPAASSRLVFSTRKSKREALSKADWQHIASQLPYLLPDDALLMALLLYTGMRRGEVLGLRWGDIDLDHGLIHVERSITFGNGNGGMIGPPKSDAGFRSIPIMSGLLPYLTPSDPEEYLLGGKEFYTESKFDRAWQRIGRMIDLHEATPHILRHTYLTIMGGTDTDVKTIQAIAGHADIKMTMERYVHRQNERILLAGKNMDAAFAQPAAM